MLLCPFPPHTPLQFPALSSGEELLPLRGLLLPLGRRREAAQMHVASQIFRLLPPSKAGLHRFRLHGVPSGSFPAEG